VTTSEIEAAVSGSLPGERLVASERIDTGKANTNFRLRFDGRADAHLRFYVRDPSACRRETALAGLVADRVPIPGLINSNCDAGFSIWEWVEAEHLADGPDAAIDCAFELGRVLAATGSFEFDRSGFLDADLKVAQPFDEPCAAYIHWMRECLSKDIVRDRMGLELAQAVEAFIDGRQSILDPYRGARRLVHSDYKSSNILIRDGRIEAVLDWEFAHSGSPLIDIAVLFRHRRKGNGHFAERFAEGFTGHGGFLDPHWLAASHYLDLISLIDFLSREHLGPIATADCVRLISETLVD
jgi:aminoglycoside phosphotransferase (APT) family kinase protein